MAGGCSHPSLMQELSSLCPGGCRGAPGVPLLRQGLGLGVLLPTHDLLALPAPMPAAGHWGCLHGVEPEDAGMRHPQGLSGASPWHHTGTTRARTGLPCLRAGHGQGVSRLLAWSGAVNTGQAAPRHCPAPPALPPSPSLPRCSLLSSHIPSRVFMAFLSPRCPRLKIAPFKGAAGLRVTGALPAAGCSPAIYRLIYWESSLVLVFS